MNVTTDLDARFRAAAVAEGLVDVRYDVVASPVGDLPSPRPTAGSAASRIAPTTGRSSSRAASACACSARRSTTSGASSTSTSRGDARDVRPAARPAGRTVLRRRPARAGAASRTAARHLRRARGAGRAPEGGPRSRHGHEPQPDPDRPAVPPHRRRERLPHRLRGRARRQAPPARARGCKLRVVTGS